MRVVIIGAAGFLECRLIKELLRRGTLADAKGRECPIERIHAFDVALPNIPSDERLTISRGDITDPEQLSTLITSDITTAFHLAAVVSGQAERDFDLGMRVNLDATRLVMEGSVRARPKTHRMSKMLTNPALAQ